MTLNPKPPPERAQAAGQYNVTLAQFFEQVFSAAEASGAAAILPYKFIPYEYDYNRALYEFGTNSAAYTCGVASMIRYQAQRVRHLATHVPQTYDQGLKQCMGVNLRTWSSKSASSCSEDEPVAGSSVRQCMMLSLCIAARCTRGVATCRHSRRCACGPWQW